MNGYTARTIFHTKFMKRILKSILLYIALQVSVVYVARRLLPKTDVWRHGVPYSRILGDEINRLELARTIFNEFEGNDELSQRFRPDPDMNVKYGVLVVTSDRSDKVAGLNAQYATETVSSLLHEGLKLDPGRISILICNVDRTTIRRRDIRTISKFVDVIDLPWDSGNGNYLQQQRADYADCLRQVATNIPNAEYYLVLEDDAYLKVDFFTKLDYILKRKISVGVERGEPVDRSATVGQVKFYVGPLLSRYHTDIGSLLEILSMSFVLMGLAALVYYLVYRSKISVIYLIAIFQFSFVSCVIIGRNNIFFHRNFYEKDPLDGAGYSIIKPPGCCMAAVLYPRRVLPELVDFLGTSPRNEEPVDVAIAGYFERKNLRQFLIYPHLVRHIGDVSSNNRKNIIKWKTWRSEERHSTNTALPWI